MPCSRTLPGEAGFVCSSFFFFFFFVVDGQTLIKGVFLVYFCELIILKVDVLSCWCFVFFIASCSVVLLVEKRVGWDRNDNIHITVWYL